jgi:superfamily I DNA/RNA helicase
VVSLNSLNPQQRQAVMTRSGPVLILAGAGTGKTRVITHRIAHLIQSGIPGEQILAVTFTNKAAREMAERVKELIPKRDSSSGEKAGRPLLCTFHSLGVRILREHIEKLGYKRNFVIYDQGDQLATIKKILASISTKDPKSDPQAILSMISRFRQGGKQRDAFSEPEVRALAEHVIRRYESALRACNAVDFDDLLLLPLRLFRENEEALARCRERFQYVMVDEYQDTNAAQFELVHALTRETRNLCVVGDDDQSIYGWRGAESANLTELEQHFPEVKIIKLEQNYRSTNSILKTANALIRNNPKRRGKELWSSKGDGPLVSLQSFEQDEEESKTIVETIEYDRLAHKVAWRDQAILFRTNLQARPLETALRQRKIRYRLIGGQSFFDRREIRDFLAYLRVLVNPEDDVSLLRIANTPARGLSDVTMERLLAASQERSAPVFAVMRHTDVLASLQPRTAEALRTFVRWIETTRAPLNERSPLCLARWAEDWLRDIAYEADLRRTEKTPDAADNRIRNLHELIRELDPADGPVVPLNPGTPSTNSPPTEVLVPTTPPPADPKPNSKRPPAPLVYRSSINPMDRLNTFLDDLSLDQDRADEREDTADAVTLITMHAAKGLEFPYVHVVGLEDGLLPHARSKLEGTLDEERRLFYVAITRAQQQLRITYCRARRRYGQLIPCHPSPFLKELPPDCIEDAEAAANQLVPEHSGADFFARMRQALD